MENKFKKIYMVFLLSILIIFSNEKVLKLNTDSNFNKIEILKLIINKTNKKVDNKIDFKAYIKTIKIKKHIFNKLKVKIKLLTYSKIKGINNLKFIE